MDITWLPAWRLGELIATGKLSSVEATRHFLGRIEALNPRLNAFVNVDAEQAMADARAADAAVASGRVRGPLHGVPVAVKDLIDTEGLRTRYGSKLWADHVPAGDAHIVTRLREAGCVILGKTATPEFGSWCRTKSPVTPECRNPWDTDRIPGASSGGSGTAVAAGLAPIAIGNDGGGSVRMPAAYCGVFGMHPSPGRVSNHGTVATYLWSSGPLARDVRDAALMLQAISGHDPKDAFSMDAPVPDLVGGLNAGVAGLRLGWSADWGFIPIGRGDVLEAVRVAAWRLQDAGARVDACDIAIGDIWTAYRALIANQSGWWWAPLRADPSRRGELTPHQSQIQLDPAAPADVAAAERILAEVKAKFDAAFARFDLIVTPATTLLAPLIRDDWESPYDMEPFRANSGVPHLYLINFTRMTAASVPCGFVDGLPVAMQIVGRRGDEARVMAAAEAFRKLMPWEDRHPALAL